MTPEPKFLRRFEQIRTSLRRYQGRLGLAATVLAASVGLGLLAWADYRYELPRSTRAIGLATAVAATLFVLGRWLVAPLRWWTQPRTAFEIEGRFPELGQRIRTVVQFAGRGDERIADEGVKPSLVQALEAETEERANPLPLDRIVRWRRAHFLATLAAIPVALLAVAATVSHDWRVALQRSVLIERPYTTVVVNPGNVLVDQGENVPVGVEMKGRPRSVVVLQTRPVGKAEAPWKSGLILNKGRLETIVEKVKDPIEYRFVAGPIASPSYTIKVRYPLAIKTFEVEVKPPAYTGLEPNTTKGGDFRGVEGSVATFKIAFDEAPSEASLELVDPASKAKDQPASTSLPLRVEGKALVATLAMTKDLSYQVVARTADGRVLPRNKYRIDVREDRAPRVVFDEPDEAIEVHPVAEVRHRVRVDDDFGLTRAGIVFRFNDGDEKTLIFKDFPPIAGQKPRTSSSLEEALLMETFNATPLDSVTYYAFAEDNFPTGPRRTETDLRYIDLRSFKREYKLGEAGSAGDGELDELILLDELIARQRVNLNRAYRLVKRKATDRTEAEDPLKIAGFQEALLNLTKEFTEGIEQLADARVDSLHKALDAMQAALDSLDRSRNAEAPPAMAEALKFLVAARRDLIHLIADNPALAAKVRMFDRSQAQKIRKPKGDKEEAEELAEKIEELAREEDFVYATIAPGTSGPLPAPKAEKAEKGDAETKDMPKEGEKKENGEDKPGEPAKKEGPAPGPKGGSGQGGDAGKDGPNGENGGEGEPKKFDRRAVAEAQEKLVDEVHDVEEMLKKLEAASDLAKARMAQAAEKVEKASGALTRGNTKEAADDAKAGAGMLHELARQVKGEIAREAADQLAMARDLAEELARREGELADRNEARSPAGAGPAEPEGEEGPGEGEPRKGEGSKPGPGEGETGQGEGSKPGPGAKPETAGTWDGLTEREQVERMGEMARTLEAWLKQIDKRGEGKAADAVGEILDKGNVAEIVEQAERMGDVYDTGKKEELGKEAREQAGRLEALAQALEQLHQGIVAPQLAAMVEFDRRVAELVAKMDDLKTEAEVAAWKREVAALIRDLEKAGIGGATELADALKAGGDWAWDDAHHHWVGPAPLYAGFRTLAIRIKDRVQDLILKDLASARDEATPPMFRELVERYYEVLSKGARAK